MTVAAGALITVDGQVEAAITARILKATVLCGLSRPTRCDVLLAGLGGPDIGATLALAPGGTTEMLFEGTVDDILIQRGPDGTTTTRVRAHDALHQLRHRQQARVLTDLTTADLAEALTSELGLTVRADEPGPRMSHVVQHRQSDLDLLVESARRAGLYLTLAATELRLTTLAGYGDPIVLEYGRTLWQADVRMRSAHDVRPVTALGWDAATGKPISEVARQPRPGSMSTEDGQRILVDQPGTGPDELAALAQCALDTAAASVLTVRGTAAGDPRLRPGVRLRLGGLADGVDGDHVVAEVHHVIDGGGFQSRFSTEPPVADESANAGVITLGRVSDVADPEERGRVRVELATHGAVDAGWLSVLTIGAGPDKGLVILPDVDDTVLVALPHGSAAEGIVLGGLYGGGKPTDSGVDGGSVSRWSLRTPKGQSIVADDGRGLLRLENGDGSVVELAPGQVTLRAHADLTIEAPGRAITLRARAVDFDHAPLPLGGI